MARMTRNARVMPRPMRIIHHRRSTAFRANTGPKPEAACPEKARQLAPGAPAAQPEERPQSGGDHKDRSAEMRNPTREEEGCGSASRSSGWNDIAPEWYDSR